MTRKLILTTAALVGLTAGSAFAQQNNNSANDTSPSGPNCASNATAGCPQEPEDLNTQSGPGTTGADSQPAPGGADAAPANTDGQQDGDLGSPESGTDGGAGTAQ
jgi:hypothetical protein